MKTETLFPVLSRPRLWERSEAKFWDDPYISAQMLEAHLDPDCDSASRKEETLVRSAAWLGTVLPKDGSVLDLGCGPGLYTARLARMGYRMTGIDLSARSIEYAAAHDAETHYRVGNYLTDELGSGYDAVTLIYCDYAALTAPERQILLGKIRRALKPGGLFLFDVFTRARQDGNESQDWYISESGGFWSAMPHLCLDGVYYFEDGWVKCDRSCVITDDGAADYIIWDSLFDRERLTREMEEGGFAVRDLYGDVCGATFSDASETICCVASPI